MESTSEGAADWYETHLVDDASLEEGEYRDESIWDLCQMKNMVFYIASTELANTNAMPLTACSVRVEHRMSLGGGPDQTLYFHNTERMKPLSKNNTPEDGVMLTSTRIVFSTEWSNQNILKMMPAPEEEIPNLYKVKDFIPACATYAATLSDSKIPTDDSNDPAEIDLLFGVIDFQLKGEPSVRLLTGSR